VQGRLQSVTALALLVCVLAIFVFPLTDLPGTALRSTQKARLLALRLAAAASMTGQPGAAPSAEAPALVEEAAPSPLGQALLALTCARLC